jgi:hypothetical protein
MNARTRTLVPVVGRVVGSLGRHESERSPGLPRR